MLAGAAFGQTSNWQLAVSTGFNLSFNQMETIQGEDKYMTNAIRPGGYWSILMKPSLTDKTKLIMGIDHVAYKYHYRYRIDQGNGGAARSTAYIWGFPLGIENTWTSNCIGFSTSYGLKYRINRLGSPFALNASSSVYNPSGELVFSQVLLEDNNLQNNHLIALFLGAELSFHVRENFAVAITLNYNQGLNMHESFRFTARNLKPFEEILTIDQYKYHSKASYLAMGLAFNIYFNQIKNKGKGALINEKQTKVKTD